MGIGTTALASLVIGAASSALSAVGQHQQAKAQAAYQAEQAKEYNRITNLENQAAVRNYAEQSASERISQMQEQEATASKVQAAQQEALRKKGSMMASSNASGMALDYLMADYGREEAAQKERIRDEYRTASVNSNIAISNLRTKTQDTVGSRRAQVQSGSSYSSGLNALGTVLGIGKSVVGAFK